MPEIPFNSMEAVAAKVKERDRCDSQFTIIVAAEGARCRSYGELIYQDTGDAQHAPRLGGVGNYCRTELEQLTGKETRCVALGHLQRG